MTGLNTTCKTLLGDVEQALGVTVIDLTTGKILAVSHNTPYFTAASLVFRRRFYRFPVTPAPGDSGRWRA